MDFRLIKGPSKAKTTQKLQFFLLNKQNRIIFTAMVTCYEKLIRYFN